MLIHRFRLCIFVSYGPVKRHDQRDRKVYLFGGLRLADLDIARWVGLDDDIIHAPPQDWMTAVGELAFQCHLHQFFRRRAHRSETLTERDDGHALSGKAAHKHLAVPGIKGKLHDLVHIRQFIDLFFDGLVIDHISVRGQDKVLLLP